MPPLQVALVELVAVESRRGSGTEDDPVRSVNLYYSRDGRLLAEQDLLYASEDGEAYLSPFSDPEQWVRPFPVSPMAPGGQGELNRRGYVEMGRNPYNAGTVVLCTPGGWGGGEIAERLRKLLHCSTVVEQWNGKDPLPPGALALTSLPWHGMEMDHE